LSGAGPLIAAVPALAAIAAGLAAVRLVPLPLRLLGRVAASGRGLVPVLALRRAVQGGTTAAVLYSVVGTCKHLRIDPFAYLREALPGVFALGEEPTAEQLGDWLPDRWLLRRTRDAPLPARTAG